MPKDGERINVLLVGVDKLPDRTASLTDTMIVASLDPVGKTVSMLSLPRDMVGVPLGNGDVYGPKLNSLMSFAERNPESFPKGGMRTLEDAVGALLGIPIHYYARIDFIGFIAMVDAVGGVDIDVKRTLRAKHYDGYGLTTKGFRLTKGVHHLTGAEALAYARIRKGVGETDFTRAGRQQEVIVALRSSVTSGGSLFWRLPDLLDAVANTIKTNVPTTRLPELAAIIDEVGAKECRPGRHRPPAGRLGEHQVRLVAGPEDRQDPGRRRPALLDAGDPARSRGRRRRRPRPRRRARPPRPSGS